MRKTLPATLVLGIALSGCASTGGSATPARAAGAPALSVKQAQQVLATYQGSVTQADRTLDGQALAAVESGPQLQMDQAAYKLHRATRQKYAPVAYTAPAFYIPRLPGYPRWFAVDATQGRTHRALLFQQQRADAPWLLIASPAAKTAISGVSLDAGRFATALAPDSGLAIAPAKLPGAHAALLTGGPMSPGAAGLGPGAQTSEAYSGLQQAKNGFAKVGVTLTSQFQPAGQPVYALRTGGGALVWYVLQQHETYTVKKPGALSVTGDLVGLAPSGKVNRQLDTTVLIQYLAAVPAKGAANVTGLYRKAVAATAS